jgi:hypothetical protein
MKRLAISLLLCAALVAVAAAPASAKFPKYKYFHSPSGNIGCALSKGGVRCDISEHTWPTPPKPADCDVDYGGGVAFGRHGPAGYVCAGDTVLNAGGTLEYGDRISAGSVRCASKTKGMRCVDLDSDHGFFLSRAVVHLF